jgi:hypothetical protein
LEIHARNVKIVTPVFNLCGPSARRQNKDDDMPLALVIAFPFLLLLAALFGGAIHLGNPVVIGMTAVALAGACTGVLIGWHTSRLSNSLAAVSVEN